MLPTGPFSCDTYSIIICTIPNVHSAFPFPLTLNIFLHCAKYIPFYSDFTIVPTSTPFPLTVSMSTSNQLCTNGLVNHVPYWGGEVSDQHTPPPSSTQYHQFAASGQVLNWDGCWDVSTQLHVHDVNNRGFNLACNCELCRC